MKGAERVPGAGFIVKAVSSSVFEYVNPLHESMKYTMPKDN